MISSVIGMVVLLGGLIFFHELGHYSIARFFKVHVEVFSLGFGKKIFSRKIGATEYCLSIFPLGGYVKLYGDDPFKPVPSDQVSKAFYSQKLYKRFLIVSAGPIFNLILAFFLYVAIFWNGKPVEAPVLGSVRKDSTSFQAGLRPNDKVSKVDGKAIDTWAELMSALRNKTGTKVVLEISRGGQVVEIPYVVEAVLQRNEFGEELKMGGLAGVAPNPQAPMVGISNPDTWGYLVGLRTGDIVEKVNDRMIQSYDDLVVALNTLANGSNVTLQIKRPTDKEDKFESKTLSGKMLTVIEERRDGLESLGLFPPETFIRKLTPGSPAEKEGLQALDRIVKVGERPIRHFEDIVEELQKEGPSGKNILFTLEREGKTVLVNLKPVYTAQEDPLTRQTVKKYMVGFMPYIALKESATTYQRYHHPVRLVKEAAFETYEVSRKMVLGIVKLVTGKVSAKNLGGPILIASFAGKSLDAGIIPFLQMMAMISLNLFLLNLLPVPVLDGGHLMFYTVEAIRGKPLSLRTMEIANQIGTAFILMLVALTFFNDITRIIFH